MNIEEEKCPKRTNAVHEARVNDTQHVYVALPELTGHRTNDIRGDMHYGLTNGKTWWEWEGWGSCGRGV